MSILRIVLVFSILTYGTVAVAQTSTTRSTKSPAGSRVTIRETFEPTFRIEPLNQRISGRSGSLVAFKFLMESSNREARVQVIPIGLRQDVGGLIVNDETTQGSDLIRLLTPEYVDLTPGKANWIEGIVQIPKGESEFHTVGLLIRDLGDDATFAPTLDDQGQVRTQAAVKFVTQYVLRLDLVVEGVRSDQANRAMIEEVAITPQRGRPRLQVMVSNPTGTTFEFELRARLRSSPTDRSFQPLRLVMPIRSSMETEERFTARILPKSRLRMEELLPEAIASGEYEVDFEMIVGGRTVVRKTLALTVNAEDFPAQAVIIGQAAEGLQISPSQIELSQVRGGTRRLSLLLKNSDKYPKVVDLKAVGPAGLEITSLMIQPNQMTIPAGSSRKVSVTMRGSLQSEKAVDYGNLVLVCRSQEKEFTETKEFPMAVIYRPVGATQIAVDPVVWDDGGNYPRFRTQVRNEGESHLPLDARLSISSSVGYRAVLHGGFGKWLMPGESGSLEFRIESPLPPGEYLLRFDLQTGDEPVSMEQNFQVSDLTMAPQ